MKVKWGLLILLVSGVAVCQTLWTPVVAKQHTKMLINTDGSETVVSEAEGTYWRASLGKILSTRTDITTGQTEGTFEDKATGEVFKLTYASRKAVLIGRNGPGVPDSDPARLQS